MEEQTKTPQLDNGYLRIANEIVDKLCSYRLSGEEWMVLLTILRKTYGYQKKEDVISLSQFFKATGLAKPSICRAINKLVKKRVINKKATGNSYSYCFNKIFTTWESLAKKRPISSIVNDHLQKSDISLTKKRPQKKYIKDNITKENNIYINKFIAMFKNVNPSYELLFRNKTQRAAVERLLKKYGEEWLENLINHLPEIIKMPYAPQITTPYELETKLGRLKVFLEQEKNKNTRMGVEKV
jgi:phage replication O-like protein O